MGVFRLDISEINRKQQLGEPLFKWRSGKEYILELYQSPEYFPYYIEIGDTHFRFNSAVFLPNSLEVDAPADSEDTFSSGIALVERIYHTLNLTHGKMIVTGHADTVGGIEANTALSTYRAASVYGLIVGDRELFQEACNAPHIPDKEEKHNRLIHDQLHICNWAAAEFGWPCSHEENSFDYLRTFKAFQRAYNEHRFAGNPSGKAIDVDGDFGPDTWRATFDCYEAKLSNRLMIKRDALSSFRTDLKVEQRFLFTDKHYTGCGEYHPIDAPGQDGYNSRTNRRVEILFFEPDEKTTTVDCRSGVCSGAACALYNAMSPLRGKRMETRWTDGLTIAGQTDKREMQLVSPELHAGEKVIFEPYQICRGAVTKLEPAVVEITAEEGNASAEFNESCEKVWQYVPEDCVDHGYSYFFVVRHDSFTAVSARLHAATDDGLYK